MLFTTTATYPREEGITVETVCFYLGLALGHIGVKPVKLDPVIVTETEIKIVFHHDGVTTK